MSAVTIACSFCCHKYLTDKRNSFGDDIVPQLMHEAKYAIFCDDVTLLYIWKSAERFLLVQQIVSHSHWKCDEDRCLPLQLPFMPAGLTTVCPRLCLSVDGVSLHLLKKHSILKYVLLIFHEWSWQAYRHGGLTFFIQTCGVTGFRFMCDAVYARARSVEMLWCDSWCFLFAFQQKLGRSFANIKTYCRPAFARGQCQYW